MSLLHEDIRNSIEREIYLKTLDKSWREHLHQMDILKTGIGLRGYNQKDPLVEYKKESFYLFNELVNHIKFETIKTLQLIQFATENPEEEGEEFVAKREEEKLIEQRQNELRTEKNRVPEIQNSVSVNPEFRQKPKPKRNDLCPCGSGLKYKSCCGVSGPKRTSC